MWLRHAPGTGRLREDLPLAVVTPQPAAAGEWPRRGHRLRGGARALVQREEALFER